MPTCATGYFRLSPATMPSLFTVHRRLFLHCAAVAVALLVMVSSWFPSGWMLCLHHDGDIHVLSSAEHHHADHAADHDACCAHDHCVDVLIKISESNRFSPVLAPLAASVPVSSHWLSFRESQCLFGAKRFATTLLGKQSSNWQRQCDLRSSDACPLRTFRTLCLQV